jgi:predicted metal-dependent hydrolase
MLLEQLGLFFRLPPPAPEPKTRHLLIAGRIVDYQLKLGTRRLTMRIDERGLRINAPARLPRAQIEAFALEHGAWVLKKLDELTQTRQPRHLAIRDGAQLPLLGGHAQVRVLPGANRVRWVGDTLLLEARADADLSQLATRALQKRALTHFEQPLRRYTDQLGLPAPKLGISSARTRWGSCSRDSGIRVNWRLIHLPPALGDYVVAHEVAHLIEMNHSARFWQVVGTLYPEWKSARATLRQQATTLPIL